jgi:hypothetical protein
MALLIDPDVPDASGLSYFKRWLSCLLPLDNTIPDLWWFDRTDLKLSAVLLGSILAAWVRRLRAALSSPSSATGTVRITFMSPARGTQSR